MVSVCKLFTGMVCFNHDQQFMPSLCIEDFPERSTVHEKILTSRKNTDFFNLFEIKMYKEGYSYWFFFSKRGLSD